MKQPVAENRTKVTQRESKPKGMDKSIDSKIEELVSATMSHPYKSVDLSYIKKPTLGANKSKKNLGKKGTKPKQSAQANLHYKVPSLMSNFSHNVASDHAKAVTSRNEICRSKNSNVNRSKFSFCSNGSGNDSHQRNLIKPYKPEISVNKPVLMKSPKVQSSNFGNRKGRIIFLTNDSESCYENVLREKYQSNTARVMNKHKSSVTTSIDLSGKSIPEKPPVN